MCVVKLDFLFRVLAALLVISNGLPNQGGQVSWKGNICLMNFVEYHLIDIIYAWLYRLLLLDASVISVRCTILV